MTAGWCVFDGNYDIIDGPWNTIEQAETAARSHRDSADPEEHYETLVAFWDGVEQSDPQSWRANWDDVCAASDHGDLLLSFGFTGRRDGTPLPRSGGPVDDLPEPPAWAMHLLEQIEDGAL